MPQDEYARALRQELRAVDAQLAAAAAAATPEERAWTPPDGGWSVDRVLEHLVVSNASYLPLIEGMIATAPRVSADTVWRSSLLGGLLVRSLRSPRRAPAPRIWRPAAAPRPRLLEELRSQHAALERLLDAADGADWRRARTRSPASALVRLNLGDCFGVLVAHAARHLGQIERTARAARAAGGTRP